MTETGIVEGTLYVLGGFSLLTWSVILLKTGEVVFSDCRNYFFVRRLRKGDHAVPDREVNIRAPAGRVWRAGHQKLIKAGELSGLDSARHSAWYELIERAMRQQIRKEKTRLDSGLGWLASIGSTAPFIGLFGT
ncbi:MAG: MotA/TolQ/ExbB proton channel family protein, partial [Methylocella sp.]